MNDLAVGYQRHENWDEAIKLHKQTLQIMQTHFRSDASGHVKSNVEHWSIVTRCEATTIRHCQLPKRPDGFRNRAWGNRHPTTINSLHLLAVVYDDVRPVHESLPLHLEVLAQRRDVLGEDHPKTLFAMTNTAIAYLNSDNETEAIRLLEAALPALQTKLGDKSRHIDTMHDLSRLRLSARRSTRRSTGFAGRGGPTGVVAGSATRPNSFKAGRIWRRHFCEQVNRRRESRYWSKSCNSKRTHGDDDPLATANALAATAHAYLDAGMFAEAEPYLRNLSTSCEPTRHPTTGDDWPCNQHWALHWRNRATAKKQRLCCCQEFVGCLPRESSRRFQRR